MDMPISEVPRSKRTHWLPVALVGLVACVAGLAILFINTGFKQRQEMNSQAAPEPTNFLSVTLQPLRSLYTSPGERRTVISSASLTSVNSPFPTKLYGLEDVGGQPTALVNPKNGLRTAIEISVPGDTPPGTYSLTAGEDALQIVVTNVTPVRIHTVFNLAADQYPQLKLPMEQWLLDRGHSLYEATIYPGAWPGNPFNTGWDNGPKYSSKVIAAAKRLPSFQFFKYGDFFYAKKPNTVRVNGKTQDQMSLEELTSLLTQAKNRLNEYGLNQSYIFVDEPPPWGGNKDPGKNGWTQEIENRVVKMATAANRAGFDVWVTVPGTNQYDYWSERFPDSTKFLITAREEADRINKVKGYYNYGRLAGVSMTAPSLPVTTWATVGQYLWQRKADTFLEWGTAGWYDTTPENFQTILWSRSLVRNDLFLPPRNSDPEVVPTLHLLAFSEAFQDVSWLRKAEADLGLDRARVLASMSDQNEMRKQIATRQPEGHLECVNNQCKTVPGSGNNSCTSNSDCTQATHLECRNLSCTPVSGAGDDQCADSTDCVENDTSAVYTMKKASRSPTIDGNLSDFDSVESINFGSAKVYPVWNDRGLSVGFQVRDSSVYSRNTWFYCASVPEAECGVWNDDSVELAIDTNNDGGGSANRDVAFMLSDDFQVIINSNNASVDLSGNDETHVPSFDWNGQWTTFAIKTPTGYNVELFVPWSSLNFQATANKTIRLGLTINSYTGGRMQRFVWRTQGTTNQNAANWPKIKLSPESVQVTLSQ